MIEDRVSKIENRARRYLQSSILHSRSSILDHNVSRLTSRFHFYARAVGQVLSAANDDRLSACESLIDLNSIAEIAARGDRLRQDAAVVKDKNDALSVTLLNRGLGNRDPSASGICAWLRSLQKRHLRVHIGKDSRINFFKAHFDFHRSLLAIGRRNYFANLGRQLLTRQRIERNFRLKPRCNLADAGFVDVSFDFEGVRIDNRNDRAASRGAAV